MFPLSLDLRDRRVVVIGGGAVAERKMRALLDADAAVTLIAPDCTPYLRDEAQRGAFRLHAREFSPDDLHGAALIFAATDDDEVNARISALARERGIPVNDAGDASRGTFITPAAHRAGELTITVQTNGASPALAARLRDELRERYGEPYARAVATLARARTYASIIADPETRARLLRELAHLPIEELAAMNPRQSEDRIDEMLPGPHGMPAPTMYICATRASALALHQARAIAAKLAASGIASTLLHVSTKGDEAQDRPLTALGLDGVFVKEIERALRERRADYAVHSCKDLPSVLPEDMRLAAIGPREDARDAFCSERYPSLDDLPLDATVGTSSPRRCAQLRALRPDLRFEPIRGNVDTRLRRLREGEYDAIILAMAGLNRLKLRATHTVPLDVDLVVPAPGQGALAVECRADDADRAAHLHAALADRATEIAVRAERAFLRRLQAGCQAPVGAYATYEGRALILRGVIAAEDGSRLVRGIRNVELTTIEAAEAVGDELAAELEAKGGAELLGHMPSEPLHGTLCLLPRTQDRPSRIAPALRGAGAMVVEATDDQEANEKLAERAPDVLLFPSSGSVHAVAAYLDELRAQGARPLVAAMGPASAFAAAEQGFPPDIVAPEASVPAFVQQVTELILSARTHR